ncbi:MAG TPA: GNAT family N-acetyltransferase [Burkholderiales bacterium]|nr:GNAT family N-acetyltransferase [Burkholderiales bacterium]
MNRKFTVRRASWDRDQRALRELREMVFVREQNVPLVLEWDGLDAASLHVIAEDRAGAPIGTGRLLPHGRIGRMAVLQPWRGKGVGSALLAELIRAAIERGLAEVTLDAQIHALGFYARMGFEAEGAEFLDAGIPHRRMRRALRTSSQASGSVDT